MANSRLERLGTIFSRVTSLMKCGALKETDKPLWHEVYQAFPPLDEPSFARRVAMKEITPILYPEDRIRAKFHQGIRRKLFKVEKLDSSTTNDITKRAILLTYELMQNNKTLNEDEALKKATEKLSEEDTATRSRKTSMFQSSRRKLAEAVSAVTEEVILQKAEPTDIKHISQKDVDVSTILRKEAQASETQETENDEELIHDGDSLAENFKRAVNKRKPNVDDSSKKEK